MSRVLADLNEGPQRRPPGHPGPREPRIALLPGGYEFINEREPLEPALNPPKRRLPSMIPAIDEPEPYRDRLSSARAQHLIAQRGMSAIGLSSLHGDANEDLSRAFAAMHGHVIIARFREWFVHQVLPPPLRQNAWHLPAHQPGRPMIFRPDTGDGTSANPLKIVCPAIRVPVLSSPLGWVATADGARGIATLAGPTLVPIKGVRGPEYTHAALLWSNGQLGSQGEPAPFVLDSRSPNLPEGAGAYLAAGAPAVLWRALVSPRTVIASCRSAPPRSTTYCLQIFHGARPPTHVHVEFDSAFDAALHGTGLEVRSEAARCAPVPRGSDKATVFRRRGGQ
ncbi:hypothetical protein JCM3775_001275 [Rhodotorula graminis]